MLDTSAGREARTQAAEAAALVRDGDHVVISGCGAAPLLFLEALNERTDLRDVKVHHTTAWGELPYLRAGVIGAMFASGALRADVVAVTATRPNAKGEISLGPFVCYLPAALSAARVKIVETSSGFPWLNGSGVLPYDSFDVAIPCERAPLTIQSTKDHPESHAIAERLRQRRELGIHSEMVSDSLVDLIECGAVRRTPKTSGRPPVVTSFMDGTQRLYDFVNGRTDIEMDPIYELNRVENIAREPAFAAINSALKIDLTGQINAETLDGRLLAGSGGLLDFAMGATLSPGGRFIIAMPSTAKGGEYSRIVPHLGEGDVVTVPRTQTHRNRASKISR